MRIPQDSRPLGCLKSDIKDSFLQREKKSSRYIRQRKM